MQLQSLTYTSLARLDLTGDDLVAIHQTARHRNALDGVTGLLIFNGTHFLQVVEGVEAAIEDLLDRLRADSRHHQLEIRDRRDIDARSFPGWSMELARVETRYFEARDAIEQILPTAVPAEIKAMILQKAEGISGSVTIPD